MDKYKGSIQETAHNDYVSRINQCFGFLVGSGFGENIRVITRNTKNKGFVGVVLLFSTISYEDLQKINRIVDASGLIYYIEASELKIF